MLFKRLILPFLVSAVIAEEEYNPEYDTTIISTITITRTLYTPEESLSLLSVASVESELSVASEASVASVIAASIASESSASVASIASVESELALARATEIKEVLEFGYNNTISNSTFENSSSTVITTTSTSTRSGPITSTRRTSTTRSSVSTSSVESTESLSSSVSSQGGAMGTYSYPMLSAGILAFIAALL